MTAYAAITTGPGNTTITLAVRAVTYPVKIVQVEINQSVSTGNYTLTNYVSATVTGGSTVTPLPLRGGAPATTATAKSGATTSGTSTVLKSVIPVAANSSATYAPPYSYILATGSAVHLSATNAVTITIYYEEQRLQGSF